MTISPSRPQQGDTVTISVKPDDRYAVDKVVVTDRNGNEVEVMEHRDGTYTFTQPRGRATIEVTFREIPEQEQPWENPFHDVDEGAWYAEAVHYVQENGLMAGTSPTTFEPHATTSRSMAVTILWRLAGSPAASGLMDYSDVAGGDWYAQAVAWAASEGIVSGYGNGAFGPNDPVTREQLAVMLHRFAQNQALPTPGRADLSGYADAGQISGYALSAMRWACAEGIINGTSATTLAPQGSATRAQVAAMLQRFCERYIDNGE